MGAPSIPSPALTQTRPGWWKPSITDLFFLTVMTWSFLLSPNGWVRFLLDGDVFMHARLGRYMIETGGPPTVDPASFAIPSATWYAFEWLSEMIYGALEMRWGMGSIALLSGLLVGLTIALIFYDTLRRGGHLLITTLFMLVASNALNVHFHARPVLFTYLFTAIAMLILNRDREAPTKLLYVLPALTILWVNLHPGVAVLFPLLGILAISCGTWASARRYATVGTLCAAATLLNPYGIGLHKHLSATLSSEWILNHATEYKSPEFRGEFMMCLAAIYLLGLASAGLFAIQKKYPEALWILFLGYSTLISRRHGALFLIVVTPLVVLQVSKFWREFVAGQDRKSAAAILNGLWGGASFAPTLWLPAFAVLIVLFTPAIDGKPQSEIFPVDLTARNKALIESSRVYTTEQWADFLYYANYPKQKIFMDPRHDLYADTLGEAYLEVLEGGPGWRGILDQFHVDLLLAPSDSVLDGMLSSDARWEKVDEDDVAVLYRKADVSAMMLQNEDRNSVADGVRATR